MINRIKIKTQIVDEQFIKFFENYLEKLDEYSNKNKEIAFISKLILEDGSENNEIIPEENFVKNEWIDIVWYDSNSEKNNYSFIKILNRNEILDNEKIKEIFKNGIEFLQKDNNIRDNISDAFENDEQSEINYYLVNKDRKTIARKEEIIKNFNNDLEIGGEGNVFIWEIEDLIEKYTKFYKTKLYVDEGKIKIWSSEKKNNFLSFTNKDEYNDTLVSESFIFSISAKSIKELYEKWGTSIFNLNLRFFKKNKNVDLEIKNSIKNPKYFWHYNNGLVIMCDSLKIKDDEIQLNKFSIINGGQTTYNISQTDFSKDFYVVAKIICIKDWTTEKKNKSSFELANNIAISSNRQKPINNKDLISNLPSTNQLKDLYLKNRTNLRFKIYVETKTNSFKFDKVNKDLYDKENVVNVEKIMQINWCFEKLKPGTAKNGKSKMYEKAKEIDNTLNEIRENYLFYSELIYFFEVLNKIKAQKFLKRIENDNIKQLLKNFVFMNTSLIKFIIAYFNFENNGLSLVDKLNSIDNESNLLDFIIENKKYFEIPSNLFSSKFKKIGIKKDPDGLIEHIFDFFSSSIFISTINAMLTKLGKEKSDIHNVVKTNKNFISYLKSFIDYFSNNTNSQNQFKKIFYIGDK